MKYGVTLSVNFVMTFPYFSGGTFHDWVCNRDPHSAGIIVHDFTGIPDSGTFPRATSLSPGARRILELPNAGGNSVWSEVISFEVVRCLFGCRLAYTEMELVYFPYGSCITDYSVNLHMPSDNSTVSIGVSVTRAMAYRDVFTANDAERLLRKKLFGVLSSTRCVMKNMRWRKQILHIWVQEPYMINLLLTAYEDDTIIEPELRANTLVLFTISHSAAYLYVST